MIDKAAERERNSGHDQLRKSRHEISHCRRQSDQVAISAHSPLPAYESGAVLVALTEFLASQKPNFSKKMCLCFNTLMESGYILYS